ncbi:MAG: hypothetical protein H6736_22015, partial [Alphaproteobacteria bacterium]|nr:hypothetical protein [Alphaproteobacteria bacterium]
MHTVIVMSRDALYEAVWSTPINVLAREYGISSGRIVAACRELAVPRPDQGHWALAKLGSAPERTPLPEPRKYAPQEVRVFRNDLVRLTTNETHPIAAPDPGDTTVPRLIAATQRALRRAK